MNLPLGETESLWYGPEARSWSCDSCASMLRIVRDVVASSTSGDTFSASWCSGSEWCARGSSTASAVGAIARLGMASGTIVRWVYEVKAKRRSAAVSTTKPEEYTSHISTGWFSQISPRAKSAARTPCSVHSITRPDSSTQTSCPAGDQPSARTLPKSHCQFESGSPEPLKM